MLAAEKHNHEMSVVNEIVIIGGGYLFKETLPVMNKLVITKVDCNVLGDIYYPEVEMEKFKLVNSESYSKNSDNDYDFKIEEYIKL
jgi:dihydrofolate reductase